MASQCAAEAACEGHHQEKIPEDSEKRACDRSGCYDLVEPNHNLCAWEPGSVRPIPLAQFGEHYRRYRLPDESAEAALQRSLERYGQMAPVAVCLREAVPEILDGFKRVTAARRLPRWTTLSTRLLAVDERTAKGAIYGLNRAARPTQELLGRYPDITVMRMFEELRERGFTGKYSIVRDRLCS